LQQLRTVSKAGLFDHIAEELEQSKFGTDDCCETDRAWAYIHSALNLTDPDGPLIFRVAEQPGFLDRLLGKKPQEFERRPAQMAFLGEEQLRNDENGTVGLMTSSTVALVAEDLERISPNDLERGLRAALVKFGASGSADNAVEYWQSWYSGLVDFFRKAASNGKNVIFTVSY